MNRIDRLFAITVLLQHKKQIRAVDLARIFEVSERTIYRDMVALNESGVPIVSVPGEGYELMEGYYLPPLAFSVQEARSLFLAAKMLQAHSTGQLPKDLAQALAKIALVLSADIRKDVDQVVEALDFGFSRVKLDLDEPRLATLHQAIRQQKVVWICYHGQNRNQTSEREVEPHKLTYFEGTWYLDGYCRLRKDMRGFRLDRIDKLKLLDQYFEPRTGANPKPEPIEVHIRFSPSVVRWVRERQHYGYQDETQGKKGIVMRYLVDNLSEIQPWLLGWGAEGEPLAPLELREQVKKELSQMLDKLLT